MASRTNLAIVGSTLLLATSARAGIIDVPGGQPTVQAAIDAARPGDVVIVAAGTYNEAIDLDGKAITLRSADGPAATVIDGVGLGDAVITCRSGEGATTVIQGFTLTRGSGSPSVFSSGGGMVIQGASPTVIDCVFSNNSALYGGAVEIVGASSAMFTNCQFLRNDANSSGGGVDVLGASPSFVNCLFFDNAAGQGGALAFVGSASVVINCTLSGNDGGMRGGGVYASQPSSTPVLTNCIVVGNVANLGPEVYNYLGAATNITSSNILGSGGSGAWNAAFGIDGGGNLDADPLFANSAGGDLHLLPGSPSIDAGDRGAVPPEVTTDLDGRPRILGNAVDMGAFETLPPDCTGDTDGNGQVNIDDIVNVVLDFGTDGTVNGGDVDGSGLVDVDDIVLVVLSLGPCL